MQKVCILGSTGSVGKSTLDVIARNSEQYRVHSLVGGKNYKVMLDQIRQFAPKMVVMSDPYATKRLYDVVAIEGLKTEVLSGPCQMENLAADSAVDIVVAAIVGAVGLLPALAAVKAGKKVLLANKEALVMTGDLFMESVRESGAVLLPIDSEHNAIFQCLPQGYAEGLDNIGVRRVMLTASGGPFRDRSLDTFADITPEQACSHPNWCMGEKISVDSATMMNKGLEFIEACWLFGARASQVEVVIHPQSIIHSMVDYNDGSVLAQMGNPDMRTPIAHALAWPQRISSGVSPLSLIDIARLDFYEPCMRRYQCLRLATEAAAAGGTAAAMLNAANEEAVDAFLRRGLRFDCIAEVVDYTLQSLPVVSAESIDAVLDADGLARSVAKKQINRLGHGA
ncbi:MAG: 1-deoxy-D-xylulose-5-phosphate reductoisomerase [Candidatus Endonucleobacter sp. (ex Gigantidas childressi)]|nr:1-deoxy-D-xylulose-5-phosphate reductoisomerase [Candidatus Endonucleobacter sp. (ex Gigantidas childressi)]